MLDAETLIVIMKTAIPSPKLLAILFSLLLVEVVTSFSNPFKVVRRGAHSNVCHLYSKTSTTTNLQQEEEHPTILIEKPQLHSVVSSFTAALFVATTSIMVDKVWATTGGDVVVSEEELGTLPAPWIPLVFAIVLIGGTALLTGSLGDVIADEASLGNLSGARAKKEKERSRSSFFKQK